MSHAGAPCGWPGSTGNMISPQIPVNPASTALMMAAESDRPHDVKTGKLDEVAEASAAGRTAA